MNNGGLVAVGHGSRREEKLKTVNLERTQAEMEIRELEARLRIAPTNDAQLLQGLRQTLKQKRARLERLRARNKA
jgi:hypothetical protein